MPSKKLAKKVLHTFMISEMLKEHPGIV